MCKRGGVGLCVFGGAATGGGVHPHSAGRVAVAP